MAEIWKAIVQKSRTIRLPGHIREEINKILQAACELASELGREPALNEVAQKLNWPEKKVRDYLSRGNIKVFSLDSSLRNREDDDIPLNLEGVLSSKTDPNPEETVNRAFRQKVIDTELSHLHQREEEVLRKRFEIGEDFHTMKELADQWKCSRAWINTLEKRGLKNLRHPARTKKLKPFYDEL